MKRIFYVAMFLIICGAGIDIHSAGWLISRHFNPNVYPSAQMAYCTILMEDFSGTQPNVQSERTCCISIMYYIYEDTALWLIPMPNVESASSYLLDKKLEKIIDEACRSRKRYLFNSDKALENIQNEFKTSYMTPPGPQSYVQSSAIEFTPAKVYKRPKADVLIRQLENRKYIVDNEMKALIKNAADKGWDFIEVKVYREHHYEGKQLGLFIKYKSDFVEIPFTGTPFYNQYPFVVYTVSDKVYSNPLFKTDYVVKLAETPVPFVLDVLLEKPIGATTLLTKQSAELLNDTHMEQPIIFSPAENKRATYYITPSIFDNFGALYTLIITAWFPYPATIFILIPLLGIAFSTIGIRNRWLWVGTGCFIVGISYYYCNYIIINDYLNYDYSGLGVTALLCNLCFVGGLLSVALIRKSLNKRNKGNAQIS